MIPADFHFIEPHWFFALLPLLLILVVSFRRTNASKNWEKVIDPKLLPFLLQGKNSKTGNFPKYLLGLAWLISVIALADPVWKKIPKPIFQTDAARVIVLDLSNSMLVDDLKPNRLARARFKIEDILSRKEEGQTGLVLFAGEAFTASPLTRDTETIRSILKVLTPQIMPAQGSRVDLGLKKAHELLQQAGINKGQVLLIADGISQQTAAIKAARRLATSGHRLSVLGIGTKAGGTLRFRNNKTVNIQLEETSLKEIAEIGQGNYRLISNSNTDLASLLLPINSAMTNAQQEGKSDDVQSSDWQSNGPLIALLLLPFGALAFRRGWLIALVISLSVIGLGSYPQTVMAKESKWWETAFKNKLQQADIALKKGEYEKILPLTDDPSYQGSAAYKLGNFDMALEKFQQQTGASARYNEGNTLAYQKKYKEAIVAYDSALKINPAMEDAQKNKHLLESLLKKQQEEKSPQNQQSSEDGQQGGESQNQANNNDSKNQKQAQQGNSKDQKGEKQNQGSDEKQQNQFTNANNALDDKKQLDEEQQEQGKNGKALSDESSEKEKEQLAKQEKLKEELTQKEVQASLQQGTKQQAETLSKEEKMAAEQWLRRIPDDPGGLLKRKFSRQYNRTRRNTNSNENPW